jgi:hypothetical protein
MILTVAQSRAALAEYGIFIREICDKCGAALGAVRHTRAGDAGVWCSRECRGDGERRAIRKNGRPRKYRNGEESRAAKTKQQRGYRLRLGVEKTSCMQSETKDLRTQKVPLSTTPLTPLFLALETASNERQAGQ